MLEDCISASLLLYPQVLDWQLFVFRTTSFLLFRYTLNIYIEAPLFFLFGIAPRASVDILTVQILGISRIGDAPISTWLIYQGWAMRLRVVTVYVAHENTDCWRSFRSELMLRNQCVYLFSADRHRPWSQRNKDITNWLSGFEPKWPYGGFGQRCCWREPVFCSAAFFADECMRHRRSAEEYNRALDAWVDDHN